MTASKAMRIGFLVFDDVEELDLVGPWEVFGVAERLFPGSFALSLLSLTGSAVRARYGLKMDGARLASDAGPMDLLIVPGGAGVTQVMQNGDALAWIRRVYEAGAIVASVCTGALVLAAAGLLEGKRATTHWLALDKLRAFPGVHVEHERFIDLGKVVTSAGISSGIDMAFHLMARFLGPERAEEVAHRMEYEPRASSSGGGGEKSTMSPGSTVS